MLLEFKIKKKIKQHLFGLNCINKFYVMYYNSLLSVLKEFYYEIFNFKQYICPQIFWENFEGERQKREIKLALT